MIGRLKNLLGRLRPVASAPPPSSAPAAPPPPTFAEELQLRGHSRAAWVAGRRASEGRLYSSLTDDRLAAIREAFPDLLATTVAAAERVCRHDFDMLGSGPYQPRDPGRVRTGYQPIDWYLDPIQNLRFPERVPYKSWNLMAMRPGLADVKLPWEIGRCQHWLPLAQAFALTKDERFATEILDQHEDFIESNPVGLGIQWTCTMDVAIRALNWAMALELIQARTTAPAERIERLYESLFDLGVFIENNLENTYEVTSNHFLSNVVGLYGVGLLFSDLPSGQRWVTQCRGWLEQEMKVQVLPDGADYESSVPYHRLVAELFLSGWRMSLLEGRPLSNEYRDQLREMMVFLRGVLRPDGTVPQIGDADDGRVHIFSNYAKWLPQDARHLFSPAAALFNEPSWSNVGEDPWAQWEAAWWGLDPLPRTAAAAPVSHLYADAGLAVVRDAGRYLLISNGKVGTNGFGNHKHNDLLSFEYHDHNTPLIVDPGSYVYTSNPDARNLFRSTVSHNTLVVDNEEQNEFKTEWLFRMFEKAKPEHLEFTSGPDRSIYRGRHDGYSRLSEGVVHERAFELDHRRGVLWITDQLAGDGTHALCWPFHCAPGVAAATSHDGISLQANNHSWLLRSHDGLPVVIQDGWYSPSYGVRVPASTIQFRTQATLSKQRVWTFSLEPKQ